METKIYDGEGYSYLLSEVREMLIEEHGCYLFKDRMLRQFANADVTLEDVIGLHAVKKAKAPRFRQELRKALNICKGFNGRFTVEDRFFGQSIFRLKGSKHGFRLDASSVKEARQRLKWTPVKSWCRRTGISIRYDQEFYNGVNLVRSGQYTEIPCALAETHKEVLKFVRDRREKHNLPIPKTETIKMFAPAFR